jgi:hypothetical protein
MEGYSRRLEQVEDKKKWKHNLPELMGHSKGRPQRKVYSHEYIY